MKYTPAIYDRAASDITDKTSKAYFNIADWLRLYENTKYVNYLVELLLNIGITFNEVLEPTITTIPTVTELNTLLANIQRIRDASGLPELDGLTTISSNWLAGSSTDAPNYIDANDWERVVNIILNSIGLSAEYVVYCGVGAVGQMRFYQHRFRQYPNWVQPAVSPVRLARTGFATTGSGLTRNNRFRRYT